MNCLSGWLVLLISFFTQGAEDHLSSEYIALSLKGGRACLSLQYLTYCTLNFLVQYYLLVFFDAFEILMGF